MEHRGDGDPEDAMMAIKLTHVGGIHVDLSKAFTNAFVPAEEKLQGPLQVMDALFRANRSLPYVIYHCCIGDEKSSKLC